MSGSAFQTESMAQWRSIVDANGFGVAYIGSEGLVRVWNAWIAAATGIGERGAMGRELGQLFPDQEGSRLFAAVRDAIKSGRTTVLLSSRASMRVKDVLPLYRIDSRTGERSRMVQRVVVRPLVDGAFKRGCLIQIHDQTALARQRARLLRRALSSDAAAENYRIGEEQLQAVVGNTADAVVTFDDAGVIDTCNPSAVAIFGFSREEIIGRNISLLIPEMADRGDEGQRRFVGTKGESLGASKEGESFAIQVTIIKLNIGEKRRFIAVIHDLTERKQSADRIQHLAHHDSLTGLPNRVLFHERLRSAMSLAYRTEKPFALLLMDLDRFKDVNDGLGHRVGDMLLKEVSARLKKAMRTTDTVARLGADEFALILPNLRGPEDAAAAAGKVLEAIDRPYTLDGNEVLTSCRCGIAFYPDDGMTNDELLRNADLALHRCKEEAAGRYRFFVSEMNEEVQKRKEIEAALRQAIGTEQFEMYYQPLVDMRTGRITGAEALIRWNHPEKGFISPVDFIPVAERTGLIVPLGRWILWTACHQFASWARSGLAGLTVAVNLSAIQFEKQDMVEAVREMIVTSGIAPKCLQLEITEGIAMNNVEETIEILEDMRALGTTISIDDFGTGYSSLNYLKQFPVDKLKIDRSFVTDIGIHPNNAAIVSAIVNLGHLIGAKVNVEGIETPEQVAFLRSEGADEGQGYYFSRPLPAEEFEKVARKGLGDLLAKVG